MTDSLIEPLLNNFVYDDNNYYISLDNQTNIEYFNKTKKSNKLSKIINKKKLIMKFDFLDKGRKVTKIIL